MWRRRIFWTKSCCRVLVPKGPKMRFFKFCEKSTQGFFVIFYMKLQQHKVLKWTVIIVLGKFSLEVFGTNGTKVTPKWGFLYFIKNRHYKLFWTFAQTYSSIRLKNWLMIFIWTNLNLSFLWQSGPKMEPKWGLKN